MAEQGHAVAVLLMSMGGPDGPEGVEAFLRTMRGGRSVPGEVVERVRQRYRAVGERPPVLEIFREVAGRLAERLDDPGRGRHHVSVGLRYWPPFLRDAYARRR